MNDLLELSQRHLERLDMVVQAAEIKWGILGKLETLCSPDTAAKFQRHWNGLSEAIMDSRHADVCLMADGAIRGVWRMEAEAIAAGHAPQALMPFGVGASTLPAADVLKTAPTGFNGVVPSVAWFKGGGDDIPW